METTGDRVMVPKGPRATRRVDIPDYARAMPGWWEPRDTQLDAVEKIAAGFEAGARVMFLDSPTGTGKSAMGELTRLRLGVEQGLYVCTTKSLQEQVARDFPDARVLKGRRNYTPRGVTTRQGSGYRQGDGGMDALAITCADCDRGPRDAPLEEQACSYCPVVEDCPYLVARSEAARAPVGVLNTAFLLTHLNGGGGRVVSPFRDRGLVVADECDTLESALLGYVEVRVAKRWVERLGLEAPKKGSHMTTIRAWLGEEVLEGLVKLRGEIARDHSVEGRREHRRVEDLVVSVRRVLDREDGWVRDGDDEERAGGGLVLKPIVVSDVGDRFVWKHADRWLCMSGTIVSAETMAEGLGLEEAGVEWGVVQLDMPFARDSRVVKYLPVATMTRKGQEAGGLERVLEAIDQILAKHPGVNVLIHAHTYLLTKAIVSHLRGKGGNVTVDGRHVFTYTNGAGRDGALAGFKRAATRGGGVMVAPSMDRGVDLPHDEVRVQIIVKVPMASLGDRQVSERLRAPGGDVWYLAETVRTVMQMTGRGTRAADDWSVCYVLDKHFSKTLKDGKRLGMWPGWWLDGLELGRL